MLVAPGVPNGTPAVITSLSPAAAKPSRSAMVQACETMSENFATSSVRTAWTPRTSTSRRAVSTLGVNPMIGTPGRSRAARSVVEPVDVNVVMAAADTVPAIWALPP